MKTKTLLEKAKAAQRKSKIEPDADTLFAWLKGEITGGQISTALGRQPSYAYYFIVQSLKAAYAQGRIKIVEKP